MLTTSRSFLQPVFAAIILLALAGQAFAQTPMAGPPKDTARAAVLEVRRANPTDSDEAWHRQILTVVGTLQHKRGPYDALGKRNDVQQLRAKFSKDVDLQRATYIANLPNTALLAVWVNCSDDPAVCAAVTDALVNEILDEQSAERANERHAKVDSLNRAINTLSSQYRIHSDTLIDYVNAHGADRPIDPMPDLVELAKLEAQVKSAPDRDTAARLSETLQSLQRQREKLESETRDRNNALRAVQARMADLESEQRLLADLRKQLTLTQLPLENEPAAIQLVEHAH